jgi:3-methyladenine DNA glycosylase AlkD
MNFLSDLELAFIQNASEANANPMAKYMKNHFHFFGIKSKLRKDITKAVWKTHKEAVKKNVREIGWELFNKKEREFHYAAMEILIKELKNNYIKEDINLIEKLLTTHAWWDSVDLLAKYLLGNYLIQFPDEIKHVVGKFSNSDNIWLNRSAILFQLDYKTRTDSYLLFSICKKHAASKEFFIQKSIGWALREYAKTNVVAVKGFVEQTNLKPLSKKEALKNIF